MNTTIQHYTLRNDKEQYRFVVIGDVTDTDSIALWRTDTDLAAPDEEEYWFAQITAVGARRIWNDLVNEEGMEVVR